MDLVVLAAGMGSRFGGLKQIQPIDEDNNFILDYSIYDAVRAGFDRVIFIIKEENREDFESTIGKRLRDSGKIKIAYAYQSINNTPSVDNIPTDRVKPWGTAHAVYCAKDIVGEEFAVINSDDFYGYESFKLIADFFRENKGENEFISAGFLAKNTLSSKGAVKRGIFSLDKSKATNLVESEIKMENGKMIATPLDKGEWREISDDTLVSMTMFGFTKKLMTRLEEEYNEFFRQDIDTLKKAEFLLPTVVNNMMHNGEINLNVYLTNAKWYGVTYREDLEEFTQAIKKMKDDDKYPLHLYDTKEKIC